MVDEKSNEITAIPELLAMLDLKDTVITIDALGTQTFIIRDIIKREGDYLVSVNKKYHLTIPIGANQGKF